MDITLTPGPDGRPVAHRPDCPQVEALRAAGEMLMTMFEVAGDPHTLGCPCHDCLERER